jgi:hypothetical protein
MVLILDNPGLIEASRIRQSKLAGRLAMIRKWKLWIEKEMERVPEDDMKRIAKAFKALRISTDAATSPKAKQARLNRKNWWSGGASHE